MNCTFSDDSSQITRYLDFENTKKKKKQFLDDSRTRWIALGPAGYSQGYYSVRLAIGPTRFGVRRRKHAAPVVPAAPLLYRCHCSCWKNAENVVCN